MSDTSRVFATTSIAALDAAETAVPPLPRAVGQLPQTVAVAGTIALLGAALVAASS